MSLMSRVNGQVELMIEEDIVGASSETKYGACSRSVVGRRT